MNFYYDLGFALPSFEEWRNKSDFKEDDANVNEEIEEETEDISFNEFNEWSKEDWLKVSGIGEKLAERLISSGPYKSLEEIKNVKGISERVFNNIKGELILS